MNADRFWDWVFEHDSLDFVWKTERWFRTRYRILRTWNDPREKWCRSVKVGDYVEDCRGLVLRVSERDGDDVILEDGAHCSLWHCCDDPALREMEA